MEYITEFIPDQLYIIQDFNDLPNEHAKLLRKFLVKQYGHKGKLCENSFDFGDHFKIIHWEWKNGNDYLLVVDITGYPAGVEHGFVSVGDKIVFENIDQTLTPLVKNHPLLSRMKSFEYIRKADIKDQSDHMQEVCKVIDELKCDLQEESIDEDAVAQDIQEYTHFSSDDASPISTPDATDIENDDE